MSHLKGRAPKQSQLLKPRAEPTENPDLKPPIFSFEFLQNGYCVSDCTNDERGTMLGKLRTISQLSWQELRQAPRHGLGYETIARNALKAPLPPVVTEDVNLIAFRAIGKAPMVGFRSGRTFHVLWVDRGFTVYDHG
ncbi:hypothetical protein [Pseudomonas plecoglossicida]|uniref:hypothetical protein n=1 Tax=Pseudomonas plecoglossicida TaxID=70775 RepID=UPI000491793E|nr:hypothetical protein [Pseudomonas plecoglossicida]GLR36171.1 hypothetical protein GCM10011247_15680 [Pseudomonas plecoglossicida]